MEKTQLLKDVAAKHSLSFEAVSCLWDSLRAGNGTMAQFSHPDLGGNGQWMSGGMIMLQNMFDQSLRAKVDSVCRELASAAAEASGETSERRFDPAQPQRQQMSQSSSSGWWPQELGQPASTGSQNQLRYAVFPGIRRLAISDGKSMRIFDTGHHQIHGVSQQQGGGQSLTFQSQAGAVEISQLRELEMENPTRRSTSSRGETAEPRERAAADAPAAIDPIDAIERLAKLHKAGVLTDDEFKSKKEELLRRL